MNANLEEAANIANEYIQSLDNLPNETQHILAEIQHRDTKVNALLEEIRKESQKYYRHSLRAQGQALSAKDAAIPDAVRKMYDEADELSAQKEQLADRLVRLIERARARLAHDLNKILVLQGDEPGLPATQSFVSSANRIVEQMNESLRAVVIPELPPPSPAASTSVAAAAVPATAAAAPPHKKRRVNATTSAGSIKLPSPVPVSAPFSNANAQRSRLSQQVHPPRQSPMRARRQAESTGADDEDADGEEDVEEGGEEGGDTEDQELYCYCQKLSYGEMIACDNDHCRYQWFHLSCVNLRPPLPDNWYCEECTMKLGLAATVTTAPSATTGSGSGGRKGRKKQQ